MKTLNRSFLALLLFLVGLTAVQIVSPTTKADDPSNGLHTAQDNTDIEILEELVTALDTAHQQVSARAAHALEGGEAANVAFALYHLSVAKARLAHAQGDRDGQLSQQQAAVDVGLR